MFLGIWRNIRFYLVKYGCTSYELWAMSRERYI